LYQIRRVVDRLCPDRIELNTVVRPPAYAYVRGLSGREMEEALHCFPADTSRIIGRFEGCAPVVNAQDLESRVMELVQRRPCTLTELTASLGVPLESLSTMLLDLQEENRLTRYLFNDLEYYCPKAGK
jgi:wyosine [tRNA(Phe)-imidazoG37] synthetase (radical SAM superfamily)